MEKRKVVAHFQDERPLIKGMIDDFSPEKNTLIDVYPIGKENPVKVGISQLKAIFFVKDFEGNKDYYEKKDFVGVSIPEDKKKVLVIFNDKERLIGTTENTDMKDGGFFFTPVDTKSNNEQVFAGSSAVSDIFEGDCPSRREGKDRINLLDFVQKDDLKLLLDAFPQDLGLTIRDLNGNPLIRRKFILPYCKKIRGKKKSWYCDETCGRIPYEANDIVDHECWAGVRYVGVPIIVEGKNIANISLARRRIEQFPEQKLRALARKLGINESNLLDEYKKLPVISDRDVEEAKKRLSNLARVIDSMAYGGVHTAYEALSEIDKQTLELREILRTIKETSCQITGADGGCLFYIEGGNLIRELYCEEFEQEKRKQHCVPLISKEGIMNKKGIMKEVYEKKEAILIPDTKEYSGWEGAEDVRSLLVVPLLHRGEISGIINVFNNKPNAFTQRHKYLLTFLADRAAISIYNAELYGQRSEELAERLKELQTLSDIGKAITSKLDLDDVLDKILDEALRLVNKKRGSIMVFQKTEDRLVVKTSRNLPDKSRGSKLKIGQSTIGEAFNKGEVVYTPNIEDDPLFDRKREKGVGSRVAIPLKMKDRKYGVLSIDAEEKNAFSKDNIRSLENLADYVVIALENAKIFKEREEFLVALEHEIEAPLGAIMGHSGFVQKYRKDDRVNSREIEENLGNLCQECEHMNLIIQRVKFLEEGVDVHKEEVLIFNLIEKCVSWLEALARQHEVKISHKGKEEIPLLEIDISGFTQVVYNLLTNAIKYSDRESNIEVVGSKSEKSFRIDFKNYSGIGIPDGEEKLIFQRLQRGSNCYLRNVPGTGLGLSIAREIVEAHGGQLRLTRNKYPTIFSIFLPQILAKKRY